MDAGVGEGAVEVGAYHFAPSGVDLAMVSYEFEIDRYVDYYVWKIILPLGIIVCMSWLVFWIDPTQLGPQIGLSATSVLTLIAYRFLLGNLVPRVSYLTRMDLFILGATVLVFVALIEAVTTCSLTTQGRQEAARRLDRVSRVVFPTAFTVVTVWAFWL